MLEYKLYHNRKEETRAESICLRHIPADITSTEAIIAPAHFLFSRSRPFQQGQRRRPQHPRRGLEEHGKRPFFIGEQVWSFADFATIQGPMRVDGNKKGLLTRDRRPKLAAHYFRKRWHAIPDFGYKA